MTTAKRTPFGRRLEVAVQKYGHLCVGLDPDPDTLASWSLPDSSIGVREFSLRMIEAATGIVPMVKPQVAYFERYGGPGMNVLTEICEAASGSGLLVLLDAKRGDIGSTNQAYADAYLRADSPTKVDAMTVAPYVGMGALEPFFETAASEGSGLFVLARTSNQEGERFQSALTGRTSSMSQDILAYLASKNKGEAVGSFGCVFGATVDAREYDLGSVNGFVLAPGLGFQGASPRDLGERFAANGSRVIPTTSRSIARLGPDGSLVRSALDSLNRECTSSIRLAQGVRK